MADTKTANTVHIAAKTSTTAGRLEPAPEPISISSGSVVILEEYSACREVVAQGKHYVIT